MTEDREFPIILLGLGNVGSALLSQILDTRHILARRAGLQLIPIALADTSGVLYDLDGLSEEKLRTALRTKAENRQLSTLPRDHALEDLDGMLRPGTTLVDTTASTETEPLLQAALNTRCRVVLANKHPLSGPWEKARQFLEHPHLRYEATVGAGLPVVATLRYLLDTGDQVAAIEGCLSGTLGYLCAELERGVSYSAAVYQARSLGYTEPDPREDLSGRDVARKALILARTAGWPLEMEDLSIEPLYPPSLGRLSTDEFMEAAATLDDAYTSRVQEAEAAGRVLRYVARVGPDGGDVGLLPVPQDSPLGALRGPANYVVFHTHRYDETGLVVSGPGAGPEVTAAGVLEDILETTNFNTQIPARVAGGTSVPTLTMKFGGTSISSAAGITRATDIAMEQAQKWNRLVIVVSAMSGVTDTLIENARTAASGDDRICRSSIADLRERHHRIIDQLLGPSGPSADENGERAELLAVVDGYLDDLAAFCRSLHVLGEITPRTMDAVTSLGERISARVLAAMLRQRGARSEAVDASDLIVTDESFQSAVPRMDPTRARVSTRLVPLLDEGIIPVVTGFVGATEDGVPTTLGRGGSDYSAAILGDCLDAHQVWIWSDVDGVMTADPRIVPDARVLPALSYNEVSELAYFGAKVIHPRTIRPVVERGIPLWVKNTFNPACPGTRITDAVETTPGTVKAVTAIEELSMVTLEGRGMMGVPGIAARTFAAVASQETSVLMISQASSEQSISFLIPTETVKPVIRAIEEEMSLELARRDIDRAWSLNNVVIVTAVGAGLRTTAGVAARLFGALAQAEINVIAVAQGSSECSISLVVAAEDATNAVRQIHSEVILGGG